MGFVWVLEKRLWGLLFLDLKGEAFLVRLALDL